MKHMGLAGSMAELTFLMPHLLFCAAEAEDGQEDGAAHSGDEDHDEEDTIHLAHFEDLLLDLDDDCLACLQAVGARAGGLRDEC